MNIFVVYCHPSKNSFTFTLLNEFLNGAKSKGHEVEISDLYSMHFNPDISEDEYLRDAFYNEVPGFAADVQKEQNKIQNADVIAFVYPVFWTEAPAKMVGWFDRVWRYGFAYGNRKMKKMKKAIFLCTCGHSLENLKQYGHYDAMKTVMIGDRINDRAEMTEFHVFDSMSRHNMTVRNTKIRKHLEIAFSIGAGL
jgi:NAD(P)H dehydrogenase (quinone)